MCPSRTTCRVTNSAQLEVEDREFTPLGDCFALPDIARLVTLLARPTPLPNDGYILEHEERATAHVGTFLWWHLSETERYLVDSIVNLVLPDAHRAQKG